LTGSTNERSPENQRKELKNELDEKLGDANRD